MRILYIDYALWKQITQDRGFTAYHEVVTTDTLRVWSGLPEVVYATDVEPADFADWQAAFPSSTLVPGEDTALANIVGLGATLQPRSADGTPVTASQNLTLGQLAFTRTDDGTEPMNVNGAATGTPLVLWNGTGAADTGGDWTHEAQGTETAPADRGTGTNGLDSGIRTAGQESRFSNGANTPIDGTYDTLRFWMNPQAYPTGSELRVRWKTLGGGTPGLKLDVSNYVTNMDIGVWQQVEIPIVDFNLGATDVAKILFEYGVKGGQHFYLDDIELLNAGGGGPYTYRVAADDALSSHHVSMIVFLVSGPSAGWTSTTFANIAALPNGLILRQRRLSDGEVLWSFNSKDNVELFGRYHPQDDIEFADGTLLVGFMVKPGKASIVITDDDVLEFVVRDDLSALSASRAFAHFGTEVTEL